jgi:transposase
MQGTNDPTGIELLDAAALCRHLVAEGSVYAFLADHRRDLFPDELFADLFPSGRGRPSVPADQVAMVMVLQALEGLSDREAAAQLRQNIAWKVACGLALTDQGFHPTVLTLWRSRLRASDRPERIVAAVRAVIAQTGVLAGRQRRGLDSTLLDDAVATQDTVTQLVAAIRRVRRLVPAAAALELAAHDYDHDPGKPACAWDDAEARDRLVSALVTDALAVLGEIQDGDLDAIQTEAVGLLGLVAGQDVEPGEVEGRWRIAGKVAADRVISTVDPDAPAHAQEPQQLPRRLQGASGRGTRDRAGDRGRAHPGHRRRWPHRGGVAGRRGTRAPGAWRQRLGERGDPGGAAGGRACPAHQAHPLAAAVPGGFTRDDFTVDPWPTR